MGPMGRSVADLEIATRVVVDASVSREAQMEGLLPLQYREVKLPEKLKFGYYLTGEPCFGDERPRGRADLLLPVDGFCRASPACERAVLETVEALEKQGHECVEFSPLDREALSPLRRDLRLRRPFVFTAVKGLELFAGITSADGCAPYLLLTALQSSTDFCSPNRQDTRRLDPIRPRRVVALPDRHRSKDPFLHSLASRLATQACAWRWSLR